MTGMTGMTPEETPEMMPEEMPEMTPEETPEETPEDTPEETPEDTPEEMPEETPEETPAETPEETPAELIAEPEIMFEVPVSITLAVVVIHSLISGRHCAFRKHRLLLLVPNHIAYACMHADAPGLHICRGYCTFG